MKMAHQPISGLQVAVANWRTGGTVWSAELGGLGPGYEQALQILLWEIISRWWEKNSAWIKPDPSALVYPADYEFHVKEVADLLDKKLGFSGAQVGAAKATAFQFMVYGYAAMMDKLPKERWIQVSPSFPVWP